MYFRIGSKWIWGVDRRICESEIWDVSGGKSLGWWWRFESSQVWVLFADMRSPGNTHRTNRRVTTEIYTTPKFRYREDEEEAWKCIWEGMTSKIQKLPRESRLLNAKWRECFKDPLFNFDMLLRVWLKVKTSLSFLVLCQS